MAQHGILNILLYLVHKGTLFILYSLFLNFCCSLRFVSSHNLLIFGSKWRCPETKWFKDLFYRVGSIYPLWQTNTQQFERAIKWKWKFEQLKDEAHFSLKSFWVFCQNVWFPFSLRLYRVNAGGCSVCFCCT